MECRLERRPEAIDCSTSESLRRNSESFLSCLKSLRAAMIRVERPSISILSTAAHGSGMRVRLGLAVHSRARSEKVVIDAAACMSARSCSAVVGNSKTIKSVR